MLRDPVSASGHGGEAVGSQLSFKVVQSMTEFSRIRSSKRLFVATRSCRWNCQDGMNLEF